MSRGTEVDDLDLGVLVFGLKDDVFGFQVTMDDVMLVQVQDCRENLFHDVAGELLCERGALHNSVEELSTLQILGNYEKVFVILIKLEDFHDIWMILGSTASTSFLRMETSSISFALSSSVRSFLLSFLTHLAAFDNLCLALYTLEKAPSG